MCRFELGSHLIRARVLLLLLLLLLLYAGGSVIWHTSDGIKTHAVGRPYMHTRIGE